MTNNFIYMNTNCILITQYLMRNVRSLVIARNLCTTPQFTPAPSPILHGTPGLALGPHPPPCVPGALEAPALPSPLTPSSPLDPCPICMNSLSQGPVHSLPCRHK